MENTAAIVHPEPIRLSPRAIAIARGLRRTGRIADLRAALSGASGREDRWLVLPARRDEFYFLRVDGGELRRGEDFIASEPLQPGFVGAMIRVGSNNGEVEPAAS